MERNRVVISPFKPSFHNIIAFLPQFKRLPGKALIHLISKAGSYQYFSSLEFEVDLD